MSTDRKTSVRKEPRDDRPLTTHSPLMPTHIPGAKEHNAQIRDLQMAADPIFFEEWDHARS